MRRFSLHITIDNSQECISNFEKLLGILSFDEKTIYEVTIDITQLNKSHSDVISSLIGCEQNYGKTHKAIFKNTICCKYSQLNKRVFDCLLRYGIDINIQYEGAFSIDKKLDKTINKIQRKRIPYCLHIDCPNEDVKASLQKLIGLKYVFEIENAINSDVDLIKTFDEWCQTETECYTFKTFEDILYKLLLGYTHRDCKHSSCLGKKVSMNAKGKLYFCPVQNELSYLKNISSVNKFSDMYESKNFENVLVSSLQRRNHCVECESFSVCQSGCPMAHGIEDSCGEEKYTELLQHIAKYLHKKLEVDNKLPQNPIIRRIVLVSVAYKGKLEINDICKGVKK